MGSNTFSQYVCNLKFFVITLAWIIITASIVYYIRYNQSNDSSVYQNSTLNNPSFSNKTPQAIEWENNEEIQIFREYLQIPTVHPNIDYGPCVDFLKHQAKNLDLPISVYYPVNKENPVVVITWEGAQPNLPSIMLNSHMDVVPVFEEFWIHPPFGAEIDENGNIYARGAQDRKSNGMQHLAAIRALKRKGVKQLKRTIHVVFVSNEETGGIFGMAGFVQSEDFKNMNVDFVLDEGMSRDEPDEIAVYYAERTVWKAELIFHGTSGHGAKLLNNTAGEKLNYVLNKFTEFRNSEARKLNVLGYPYGKVTTINLTILKGGVANNIIPPEIKVIFDIRFSVDADLDKFELQVEEWCADAGGNITVNYPTKEPKTIATRIDDSNPYWLAIKSAMNEFKYVKLIPAIMPSGTDARYIRRIGIPAMGFSPIVNTTLLAHDHNEYMNVKVYLFGIEVYEKLIPSLGNV